MATFAEITYAILDLLKERVDDAYYTEEHIIFLASKMRALLLERKYKNSNRTSFATMSDENIQEICLDLEPAEMLPDGCGGTWLQSVQKIPSTLTMFAPKMSVISDLMFTGVTYIAPERMPYVGHNKWLKNIIYAARSQNGHVYFNSANPQFIYLKEAKMSGVFADPAEAAKYSCDNGEDGDKCDILKKGFPLEEALIPSCIELVVQELTGSRYAPEDKNNDAKDGLGDAAVTSQKAPTPVESSEPKR